VVNVVVGILMLARSADADKIVKFYEHIDLLFRFLLDQKLSSNTYREI